MVHHLRLLSHVGFPALYQILFSYLLVLNNPGGPAPATVASVILVSAVVGIPLGMLYNLVYLNRCCASTLLLIVRPVLVAMVLPIVQVVLLWGLLSAGLAAG